MCQKMNEWILYVVVNLIDLFLNHKKYLDFIKIYSTMLSSTISFKAVCAKGDQASTICGQPECKHPSLMCQDTDCKCRVAHDNCMIALPLIKLKKRLEVKNQSCSPIFQEIYRWYESQCKLINVEMEELKGMMDNQQILLQGNEEKLYSYLVEGRSELVLPSLVAEVIASLAKEPQHNISTKIEQTKKELLKQEKNMKNILQQIRLMSIKKSQPIVPQLEKAPTILVPSTAPQPTPLPTPQPIPLPTLQKLKFVPQKIINHTPRIILIDNHTIRLNNQNKNTLKFAYLQPPISDGQYRSCKYTFQINKMFNIAFSIGVCQLPPSFFTKPDWNTSALEHGSFTYFPAGQIILGKIPEHIQEKSTIQGCWVNDIIEVEYQKNNGKLKVRNETKNTQTISYIPVDKNRCLHVVVEMYHEGDEIQVVGVEYELE